MTNGYRISIQDLSNVEDTLDCTATKSNEDSIESIVLGWNHINALEDPISSELAQKSDSEDGIRLYEGQLVTAARVKLILSARGDDQRNIVFLHRDIKEELRRERSNSLTETRIEKPFK